MKTKTSKPKKTTRPCAGGGRHKFMWISGAEYRCRHCGQHGAVTKKKT